MDDDAAPEVKKETETEEESTTVTKMDADSSQAMIGEDDQTATTNAPQESSASASSERPLIALVFVPRLQFLAVPLDCRLCLCTFATDHSAKVPLLSSEYFTDRSEALSRGPAIFWRSIAPDPVRPLMNRLNRCCQRARLQTEFQSLLFFSPSFSSSPPDSPAASSPDSSSFENNEILRASVAASLAELRVSTLIDCAEYRQHTLQIDMSRYLSLAESLHHINHSRIQDAQRRMMRVLSRYFTRINHSLWFHRCLLSGDDRIPAPLFAQLECAYSCVDCVDDVFVASRFIVG